MLHINTDTQSFVDATKKIIDEIAHKPEDDKGETIYWLYAKMCEFIVCNFPEGLKPKDIDEDIKMCLKILGRILNEANELYANRAKH